MRLATVCVDFHHGLQPGGGSTMMCRKVYPRWPRIPAVGDFIEVLPERDDISHWMEQVTVVYMYNDGKVELHVNGSHSRDSYSELRRWGYREPGLEDE